MRRHVEVANQNVMVLAARMQRLAGFHFVEKAKLVLEFRIDRGVGNVAAGGYIEIMQDQRPGKLRTYAELDRDMARVELVAESPDVGLLERQSRDDGDAVIAFLTVQRDVFVAEPLEALERKCIVDAFGFLQAQDIGPHRLDEFGDEVDAQAHRKKKPGRQEKAQEDRRDEIRSKQTHVSAWQSRMILQIPQGIVDCSRQSWAAVRF